MSTDRIIVLAGATIAKSTEMRIAPLLLSILVSLSVTLPADAGVWGSRGSSKRFVVSGSTLYAAEGRGVAAYDISDPTVLSRTDVETGDDETLDIAIYGPELLSATAGGVERFSIGSDGSLSRISGLTAAGGATAVAGGSRFAIAARGQEAWFIERREGELTSVGSVTFRHDVSALAVVADYAYVAVEDEATYIYALPDGGQVAQLGGSPTQFALSGSVLWSVQPSTARGLTKIDVSVPGAPVIMARSVGLAAIPTGVAAAGSHIYAFEPPDKVHLYEDTTTGGLRLVNTIREWVGAIGAAGTHLFIAGVLYDDENLPRETGVPLRAFDVADLSAPKLEGEFHDYAGPVSGIWTDGSVAYVVDPPMLRVLDVSSTDRPIEVRSMQIPNIQDRIRVKNGVAIIYGRAFVNLLDVSRPLAPRYLGTWDAQGHPPGAAALAYDKIVEANQHSGLHVVDYSNPESLPIVGFRIWHYHDIAAADDAIYALQHSRLLVLGIEGRTKVVDHSWVDLKSEQVDIAPPNAAFPPHLLVHDYHGLRVFSLREDRFTPKQTAFVPVEAPGIFGTGDGMAWVAWHGVLNRLDLNEPRGLVPSSMRVTSPMQISVAGEKVVVADRYSVRVYGPDTPSPQGTRRRSARH